MLQRGNELTPVIPDFILVIPDFILVIPDFILVIPAKVGIHTDSPPKPYCPVPPWPCHPREGRDQLLALDSRLRGNDDLRAWERAVGVLRQPQSLGTSCKHGNQRFCDTLCRELESSMGINTFPLLKSSTSLTGENKQVCSTGKSGSRGSFNENTCCNGLPNRYCSYLHGCRKTHRSCTQSGT
ncbi:hypothetical protein [Endozoicomonas sp. 8E]|uniref:hypothetical protein n=1 Tax=Endozoicomonas sp. 8E TaxID=3035692 RepID=UPI002938F485|nr:hypothetical protein [Endozoicomonas sp. 8E]WOG28408.1 hypothetical protein P6910_01780 [Endozoicomonas sp. 8E]